MPWDHLQVDVIVALITGARAVDRRVPEVRVLIDLETLVDGLHDDATCETGFGERCQPEVVRRLACDAEIVPIVLGGDGEVLDVGSSRRLASQSATHALRAMYETTCGFPDCTVQFDHCRIHHVTPWEHGGPTNLDTLIPLCTADHHLVHEGGWTLTLCADRTITVTRRARKPAFRRTDHEQGAHVGDRCLSRQNAVTGVSGHCVTTKARQPSVARQPSWIAGRRRSDIDRAEAEKQKFYIKQRWG